MLLQYLYFLFVKLSIAIFGEMSCVLLDSNIYVVGESQYMYNFLYFIMDYVSPSSEENSENKTNVDRLSNNLESLDVTSKNLSFSDFMSCTFYNYAFIEGQLPYFLVHNAHF